MEDIFNSIFQFLDKYPKVTIIISIISLIISFVGIYFAYVRIGIMREKHKMDKQEFNNKKANFSVFIIDYYRLSRKSTQNVYILFNVKISNLSQSKNTVYPTLQVYYKDNAKDRIVELSHMPEIFNTIEHHGIDRFGKSIQLESNDIKYGWIIFQLPNYLWTKRIEKYEIIISDGNNNISHSSCLLVKEIHYEN